jgi:ABC-type branched-subunit amino acid transport system substrate-binding protein
VLRVIVAAFALVACSRALDFSEECQSDEACASLGDGLVCSGGRCIALEVPDAGLERDAALSGRVDAGLPGVPALLAEGCRVLGPAGAEAQPFRHHLFAALVPPTPDEAAAARAAIELAIQEINENGGLQGRTFAALTCPESTDLPALVHRARRMAEAATVPALVGASTAEGTLQVVREAVGPLGLLVLHPGGPEPTRAEVEDDGLLWHLVEGAPASARAAAELARALGGRVAVVHRDDPWGTALGEQVEEAACMGPCRVPFTPFASLGDLGRTLAEGGFERIITVARPVDFPSVYAALADYDRTAALAVEGPLAVEVLADFLALDAEGQSALPAWRLAARQALLCGSGTLHASVQGPAHEAWAARFDAAWPNLARWPSTAVYADAVYLLAYAFAAVGNGEASGEDLAASIGRLQAGTPVMVGGPDWTRGLGLLDAGIDLQGASGGLQFDTVSGIVHSAVEASWYDGTPAILGAGRVMDETGAFVAPAPRPPCGEE